jgi:hypothetical protein
MTTRTRLLPILAALLLATVMLLPAAARAQAETPAETPTDTPTETPADTPTDAPRGEMTREQVREQIRARIERHAAGGHEGGEQLRQRLRQNLRSCWRHGLSGQEMAALFPEAELGSVDRARGLLAVQDRVLDTAAQDLPVGLMIGKLQEGRMKRVPAQRIAGALDQTADHLARAHRMLEGAVSDGVTPPRSRAERQHATQEMARCLWDGLGEGDLERIREQARERARERQCTTEDFVGACQAAAGFARGGLEPREAAEMAGRALGRGYSGGELRTMGHLMAAGPGHGRPDPELAREMDRWIDARLDLDQMTRHMMQGGWMGPGDLPGGHGGPGHGGMGGPGQVPPGGPGPSGEGPGHDGPDDPGGPGHDGPGDPGGPGGGGGSGGPGGGGGSGGSGGSR